MGNREVDSQAIPGPGVARSSAFLWRDILPVPAFPHVSNNYSSNEEQSQIRWLDRLPMLWEGNYLPKKVIQRAVAVTDLPTHGSPDSRRDIGFGDLDGIVDRVALGQLGCDS